MNRICVFCGSSPGRRPEYREAAAALGRAMVRRGAGLVFGGGHVGIMGAVADAVLAAGGEATGVIPRGLQVRELAHGGLTELRVVDTMHERKALMAELSDAFVALPGGMGTLEETTEVLTWAQLGIHRKPVGLLDVAGYWSPFVAMLDHAVEEGFLRPDQRGLLLVEREVEPLLDRLAGWRPAPVRRWMERDET
ncbi:MAG: TIGR00730 family Rossman fold protein [Deltaproteobacteria bacterium]|nr:TIGR00730 family Rossman fold protein [Deltaproteobacteria bacterium]